MAGAYWLNPVCLLIFISGCLLEALYCKLWQVTPLRSVVNGAVKTLGPIAAVFAVNPSPPPLFMAVLFLWFFTWEIGGQNIPNDWTDMEEDRRFNAKTIPVQWGPRRAATLIATCLAATLMLSLMALWVSPLFFGLIFMLITVAINGVLLLYPAFLLGERQQQHHAMALFNKASYYPLAMLAVVLVRFALP
jgi:4-hydroxybenzoate polyprenyltransferase